MDTQKIAGKVAAGLPSHLDDYKFTKNDPDNPNPKGNDRDGDGKTNEAKPFSAAQGFFFDTTDKKLLNLMGKAQRGKLTDKDKDTLLRDYGVRTEKPKSKKSHEMTSGDVPEAFKKNWKGKGDDKKDDKKDDSKDDKDDSKGKPPWLKDKKAGLSVPRGVVAALTFDGEIKIYEAADAEAAHGIKTALMAQEGEYASIVHGPNTAGRTVNELYDHFEERWMEAKTDKKLEDLFAKAGQKSKLKGDAQMSVTTRRGKTYGQIHIDGKTKLIPLAEDMTVDDVTKAINKVASEGRVARNEIPAEQWPDSIMKVVNSLGMGYGEIKAVHASSATGKYNVTIKGMSDAIGVAQFKRAEKAGFRGMIAKVESILVEG